MRVLHYVDENNLSWGETWIQLIEELSRQGVDNHVVCKSGGTLSGRLKAHGLPFDTCDTPISFLPVTALKLGRVIDSFNPDVISTRLSAAARTGGWWGKRKGVPVVSGIASETKELYKRVCSAG